MDLAEIAKLSVNLAIVVLFLWYLRHRDVQTKSLADAGHAAVDNLTTVVSDLKTVIVVQTEVLRSQNK